MSTTEDMKKKFPEFYKVMEKMFIIVKADINNFNFENTNWFTSYTWSVDQEASFFDWLYNELMANKKLRKEIMNISHKDADRCKRAASMFIFNYGWKRSDV